MHHIIFCPIHYRWRRRSGGP